MPKIKARERERTALTMPLGDAVAPFDFFSPLQSPSKTPTQLTGRFSGFFARPAMTDEAIETAFGNDSGTLFFI